jgi:16S rRNA C967 or C1407 C5-methylase (RsmB/RsmF family)
MERRRNLAFEAYYRAQIFYDNTSRDASYYASRETQPYGDAVDFFAALAQPSPMTLRIHMTRPLVVQQQTAKELANPPVALSSLNWVQQLLPAALMSRSTNSGRVASDEIEKGSDVGAVAWECGHDLYHTQAGLEAWCKAAHKGGTVNFQESVSLLPALLLRLEPHHAVADLCAAPGSKTTQALDLMHRLSSRLSRPKSSDKNDGTSACSFPSGFVIANEFDAKRARLYLAGRVRRVDTPCCAIVCGAAQSLPLDNAFGGTFDRVMADVPCSGDGTLRKDPRLWSGWSPRDALELHTVQLKILRRALAMLKPGGCERHAKPYLFLNSFTNLSTLSAVHPPTFLWFPLPILQFG